MYDAIVVGARCAGASTAMLLARSGRRVLLLDRDRFPSETVCTNHLDTRAVSLLSQWNLMDRVAASGCPGAGSSVVVVGDTRRAWTHPSPAVRTYSPRRSVLESVLLEAALRAGVEVRQGFTVRDLLWDDGRVVGVVGHGADGHSTYERARIVVGADGRNSALARIVGAEVYDERPSTACCYYAYWRGGGASGPELYLDHGMIVALLPTNDDLMCAAVFRPVAEWAAFKRAPEATYLAQLLRRADLALRFEDASRQSRCFGTADLGAMFRRPYGPGWVLVGDAGHHRPPVWPGGIADAFADAQHVGVALDGGLGSRSGVRVALASYHRLRDAQAFEWHRLTCALASFTWTTAGVGRLVAGLRELTSSPDRSVPVAT